MIYSSHVFGLNWLQVCVALLVFPIFFSFCIPFCPEKPFISVAFFHFVDLNHLLIKSVRPIPLVVEDKSTTKPYFLSKIYQAKVLLVILKADACNLFFNR